jgi:MFS family permease
LLPVVGLGLYGGALADAHDRRKVALTASGVMWLATFGIALQAHLAPDAVWPLYLLVATQAGATSVASPARSAIIPRLVGLELLPAANALGSMTFSLSVLCGPLAGAVLVGSIGYGPTYLVDAVLFTAALYSLLRLPPMPPLAPPRQDSRPPTEAEPTEGEGAEAAAPAAAAATGADGASPFPGGGSGQGGLADGVGSPEPADGADRSAAAPAVTPESRDSLEPGPEHVPGPAADAAALRPTEVGEGAASNSGAEAAQTVTGWRAAAEGLRFLAHRRNLLMTFLTDMCAMVLAFPRAAFPAIAAVILGGGKTTVGLLSACLAFGTIAAMVLSGPVGRVRRQGRGVVVSVALWGLSVAACGLVLTLVGREAPTQVVWWGMIGAGAALALAGAADSVSAVFRGTILQSATPDHLRGRLQGVFIVVVTGGPRLGDMVTGAASGWLGEGLALVFGGLACAVAVAALVRWHPPFWRYDARHPVP